MGLIETVRRYSDGTEEAWVPYTTARMMFFNRGLVARAGVDVPDSDPAPNNFRTFSWQQFYDDTVAFHETHLGSRGRHYMTWVPKEILRDLLASRNLLFP